MGVKQRMERVLSGSEFGGEGQLGGSTSNRRKRKYWPVDCQPGYVEDRGGGNGPGKAPATRGRRPTWLIIKTLKDALI